mmetsp:Transcript_26119/g.25978  ORF Transcript_26119/g.25978 Transcript_26119/m.25978 type:complete len:117 (+) Transcript_26119:434-784(+)
MKWIYSSRLTYAKGNFKYENIYKYDQSKFHNIPGCMAETGFAYVPLNCQYEGADCPVHILLHGCLQTYDHIGLDMMTLTHYADLAEANNFIIVSPQAVKSLTNIFNPRGCWDWWGY